MTEAFTVDASALINVRDKVTLITGGSSGIGLATAEFLLGLSPSNRVAILDRAEQPASLASERVFFHQCDATSWPAQRAGFEAAAQKFGRIDVVFANVGINERGDQFFSDVFDGDNKLKEPDRSVMDLDFTANADTVKLGIHYLRQNEKGGSIILTSSFAGYLGNPGAPFYNSAKHGLVGLMRSLKAETPKVNVAISVVAPAVTATPMLGSLDEVGMTAEENAAHLIRSGLTVNRVESVALAVGYLINGGPKSNGMGILVQGDKMVDLEKGYAKSKEAWMGKEMLNLVKRGPGKDLYRRIEDKAKI
ncbi:uncharacterized protein JN550_002432 [Neoarthrinium moseri]|uniref:uncharacterized protein n=1 Tax=Neoarthrinium moseri TaxID=1658444 RepID=UPI001FDC6A62|nr:uncharacterized protein JN550_002432 [Neoarthrinium moseri]KAI1875003.1 hypothetical protein JN550_002432 [Neoarthrinium moseri]